MNTNYNNNYNNNQQNNNPNNNNLYNNPYPAPNDDPNMNQNLFVNQGPNYGTYDNNNQAQNLYNANPGQVPSQENYQNQYFTPSNYQDQGYGKPANDDLENSNQSLKNDFELTMRLGFIRKVYGILSVQLLVTFTLCCVSMASTSFAKFQQGNPGIMIVCLIATLVIMICLLCIPHLVRNSPTNYILLGAFTLFESYLVSAICSMTSPRIVFMAAAMTVALTLALTYYACTTKDDFTICGSLLFIGTCIMLMFSIFLIFSHNRILHIIMCCFGVFLYSIYLIYDTQLLLGNKRCALDYDDYIIGALMLYVDIIQLFLYLLEILQYMNGK